MVTVYHPLRLGPKAGEEQAYPGKKLSLVPCHLRHHPPGTLPARRRAPEVVIPDEGLLWESPHGPFQQGLNLLLQYMIIGEPNRTSEGMLFQVVISSPDWQRPHRPDSRGAPQLPPSEPR
jgi:hypothetical protein